MNRVIISYETEKRSHDCVKCGRKIKPSQLYLRVRIDSGGGYCKFVRICPICVLVLGQEALNKIPDLPEQVLEERL